MARHRLFAARRPARSVAVYALTAIVADFNLHCACARLLTFSASERANGQAECDSQANADSQLMCCDSDSGADADANGEPHANLH